MLPSQWNGSQMYWLLCKTFLLLAKKHYKSTKLNHFNILMVLIRLVFFWFSESRCLPVNGFWLLCPQMCNFMNIHWLIILPGYVSPHKRLLLVKGLQSIVRLIIGLYYFEFSKHFFKKNISTIWNFGAKNLPQMHVH